MLIYNLQDANALLIDLLFTGHNCLENVRNTLRVSISLEGLYQCCTQGILVKERFLDPYGSAKQTFD
jgi:hypothetical protein